MPGMSRTGRSSRHAGVRLRRTHSPVEDRLTEAQRADLAELVPVAEGRPERIPKFLSLRCPWCGGAHVASCPRVKRMVYDQSGGRVVEVEFWPETWWSKKDVIFADDIWPADPRS